MIKARPFDFPYDGRLVPAQTALMVIDLQIDFQSQDGYFARKGYDPAPLRAIIPAVNAVIRAARQAGCLIVHTRQGYRGDLADMTPYCARVVLLGKTWSPYAMAYENGKVIALCEGVKPPLQRLWPTLKNYS